MWFFMCGPWGTCYNTKPQVEALETLRKLPDPTTPAPPPVNRPKPGRARQLDADQVQELIAGYQDGATVYELGAQFGIERRRSATSSTDTTSRCADAASPPTRSTAIHLYHLGWSLARVGDTSTSTTPPC
jgi:hypothetical protein